MAGMADDGSARVSSEEFDDLVSAALDDIPPELARAMDNVAVFVEDEPPEDGLLGLYEGVPLTERDSAYAGVLPDRITIYRRPIRAIAADAAEIVQQVRITVVHELAHHFGIADARLDERGWGGHIQNKARTTTKRATSEARGGPRFALAPPVGGDAARPGAGRGNAGGRRLRRGLAGRPGRRLDAGAAARHGLPAAGRYAPRPPPGRRRVGREAGGA